MSYATSAHLLTLNFKEFVEEISYLPEEVRDAFFVAFA